MTATTLETVTTPNFQQLHNDHRALQEQLADVTVRHNAAKGELEAAIAGLKLQWEAANAELIAELQDVQGLAELKETELRKAVLNAYLANPTIKTIAPGLSVRVTKKPVYDKATALEWAKEHGLALALDAKTFEKIASVQKLDFVTEEETVSAVIGK